jgi:hypothetical protein
MAQTYTWSYTGDQPKTLANFAEHWYVDVEAEPFLNHPPNPRPNHFPSPLATGSFAMGACQDGQQVMG